MAEAANGFWPADYWADDYWGETGSPAESLWWETFLPSSDVPDVTLIFDDADGPAVYSEAGTWSDVSTTSTGYVEQANDQFDSELRNSVNRTYLAQGFQVPVACEVDSVEMLLKERGTVASGNVWVEIWTDSSGDPNAQTGGDSDTIAASALQSDPTTEKFDFTGTKPSLSASTQYHLVLQGDFAIDGSNHVRCRAQSGDPYANGSIKQSSDGSTWSDTSVGSDLQFKINYSTSGVTDAYASLARQASSGSGADVATFLTGTLPATEWLKIYAWWPTVSSTATDTPFTVAGKYSGSVDVDQSANAGQFNELFYFQTVAAAGSLTISIDNDANGIVLSDAIQIEYKQQTTTPTGSSGRITSFIVFLT